MSLQQEPLFRELDALLTGTEDRKQQKFAAKLAAELAFIRESMTRGVQEAEELSRCEDIPEVVKGDKVDGKKVFEELAALSSVYSPSESTLVASRYGNFEKDVRGLLMKVSSETELLSAKYPIERAPTPPPEREAEDAEGDGQRLDRELKAVPEPLQEAEAAEEEPEAKPSPKLFQELVPLLESGGGKDEFKEQITTLSASMTSFLTIAQKRHLETAEYVERLMAGEGPSGHPRDQEHAAWRRTTLLALKRPPPNLQQPKPRRVMTGGGRASTSVLGFAGSHGMGMRSGSLPQIRGVRSTIR